MRSYGWQTYYSRAVLLNLSPCGPLLPIIYFRVRDKTAWQTNNAKHTFNLLSMRCLSLFIGYDQIESRLDRRQAHTHTYYEKLIPICTLVKIGIVQKIVYGPFTFFTAHCWRSVAVGSAFKIKC